MSSRRDSRIKKGDARACALACLLEWEDSVSYAAEVLDKASFKFELQPIGRSLATELFYGTLRNLNFLDAIITMLRSRGSLKQGTKCLLRLGLQQIFHTNIAEHAAVNETVNLAKKHERGLVNAILRNAQRRKDEFVRIAESWPLSDRFSHPEFLIDRWIDQHGEDNAMRLCEWNNSPPSVYARICDEEKFHQKVYSVQLSGVRGSVENEVGLPGFLEDFPEFIKLPSGSPPREWIDEGLIYIQDPSTSIAPWLLAPMPGETVLDACAAPGGKTAILASMCPEGTNVYATDSNPKRIDRMQENFKRLKIDDVVKVSQVDWSDPSENDLAALPKFDAILLDVPCSNTGVMRRRIDVRWRLRPEDFSELKELQSRILANARRQLKPGGRIVYSSCSIDPVENRAVIEESGMEIVEIRETLPWKDGVDGAFAACLRD